VFIGLSSEIVADTKNQCVAEFALLSVPDPGTVAYYMGWYTITKDATRQGLRIFDGSVLGLR